MHTTIVNMKTKKSTLIVKFTVITASTAIVKKGQTLDILKSASIGTKLLKSSRTSGRKKEKPSLIHFIQFAAAKKIKII